MATLNKVLLIGNLTRDPDLKYLPNQSAVCDFGLAVNRTWTGQDGVKKEECTFVDCTSFGKSAETLSKYKKKGDPLLVEGRLKLDQWEAQDGTKRQKMRVVVENFQFLNRAQNNGDGGYQGEPEEQAPASRSAYRPQQRQQQQPSGSRSARPNQAKEMLDAPAHPIEGPLDDLPPLSDEDIPF